MQSLQCLLRLFMRLWVRVWYITLYLYLRVFFPNGITITWFQYLSSLILFTKDRRSEIQMSKLFPSICCNNIIKYYIYLGVKFKFIIKSFDATIFTLYNTANSKILSKFILFQPWEKKFILQPLEYFVCFSWFWKKIFK